MYSRHERQLSLPVSMIAVLNSFSATISSDLFCAFIVDWCHGTVGEMKHSYRGAFETEDAAIIAQGRAFNATLKRGYRLRSAL